jgi:predicted 3-demethylubiquinone-9 3-methyltransferase (glyoxalase superfamily)
MATPGLPFHFSSRAKHSRRLTTTGTSSLRAATIQCGWLEDKYGLSWQIVPKEFFRLVQDKDPAKSQRVMKAMLQMVKLDVARLPKLSAIA